MTSLEKRVAELESKFARLESMDISEGNTEPHHIGPRSKQVVQQELTSHKQNFQETFSEHEKAEWNKKLVELEKELSEF